MCLRTTFVLRVTVMSEIVISLAVHSIRLLRNHVVN